MKFIKESFEIHPTLNKKLFNLDTNKLKEDVRVRLIEIADTFIQDLKENEIPIEVYDYWMIGSNAAYNYNSDSDIDLHIIVDLEDMIRENLNPDILKLLYNYAKASFNDKYNIKVKSQDVEVYIQDINEPNASNGIYSLKKDKWIKEPVKEEPQFFDIENTDLYKEWANKYKNLKDDEIEDFIQDLYLLRKNSLQNEGEFGEGNLVFKQMRNNNYLQDLKDRKYKIKSKELTLEKLEESILTESTLTDIVAMIVESLNSMKGVNCIVDNSKQYIIITTPLNKEYAIPVRDISTNAHISKDYKKIRFEGSCKVEDGFMPNPNGGGRVPVYYGAPTLHKHRDFDESILVYDLLQNKIDGKCFSLADFVRGIENYQL